jgi:hypothetical protein
VNVERQVNEQQVAVEVGLFDDQLTKEHLRISGDFNMKN